jgi:hypothetical protein
LGGLEVQLRKHFDWVLAENLVNVSLDHKDNALVIWQKISDHAQALAPFITQQPRLQDFVLKSVSYGAMLAHVMVAGWHCMMLAAQMDSGVQVDSSKVEARVSDYDYAFAGYNALALDAQSMPSLYHDYFFNLPHQEPEPGLGATVARLGSSLVVKPVRQIQIS